MMPYFNIYIEDYKLMKCDLKKSEIFEIFDAIAELSFLGENSYIPKTKKQEFYYNKMVSQYEKSLRNYRVSVENGKRGGRPKSKPMGFLQVNPEGNPEHNPAETKPKTLNLKKYNTTSSSNKLLSEDSIPVPPFSEYAFEGEVIKLNEKDWQTWLKAYPDLNLYTELLLRDQWLAEQADAEKSKWFISTAMYLRNQNILRKKQQNQELLSTPAANEEFYL